MANNNQLMVTPQVLEAFKPEVLQVIRTSICPTATDAEFVLFAHKAAAYKLDPFKNEIFFIKYGNQARIQFAAEAYLAKAREKEGFQPPDTQMVCEQDTFEVRKNTETKELEVVEHVIGFPRGKIIGAYSIAYRNGHRPVTVIMDRSEIDHMFTGQNKENWIKWTSDMFGKHVEQRALKKQYGLEFGDEEAPAAGDAIPAYTPPTERKDITQEVNGANAQLSPGQPSELDLINKARNESKVKLKALGHTTKETISEYCTKYANYKEPKNPTLAEITAFNKLMDLHIEEQNQAAAADDDLLSTIE